MPRKNTLYFDRSLILIVFTLLLLSVVLIYSASVQEAVYSTQDQYFYLKRQIVFCIVGVFCGCVAAAIPSQAWFSASVGLMFFSFFLLILVLIIGREVNNAVRWISLGPVNIQPAELLKLFWIIYFSSYTCRKIEMVRTQLSGFLKPMAFIALIALLLMLQPDFGSLVVVTAITFGILFVAGAGLIKYFAVMLLVAAVGGIMVVSAPYRVSRVLAFLDPWEDEFNTGYQLTQSLMAFGRGRLTGEGLGNSLQKLSFLPEAHTDFVTSIWGEETGFIGMLVLIILEFIIVCKAVALSLKILRRQSLFQGYMAFGIGLMFCLQTVINIGAASGALPTKGLTLPLISYGGSSLMVCMAAVGILLRIDFEFRSGQLINPMNGIYISERPPQKNRKAE